MKKLSELNQKQYLSLLKAGLLFEIYPEASGDFYQDTEDKEEEDRFNPFREH